MRNAIIAPGRHGAPGGKSVVADVVVGGDDLDEALGKGEDREPVVLGDEIRDMSVDDGSVDGDEALFVAGSGVSLALECVALGWKLWRSPLPRWKQCWAC